MAAYCFNRFLSIYNGTHQRLPYVKHEGGLRRDVGFRGTTRISLDASIPKHRHLSVGILARLDRLPLRQLATGGGVAFLLASGTVGLSNFVFHVVMSRLLGPSQYGALGALLNVILVLTVPLGAVQAAVTRAVAVRGKRPFHLRTIAVRSLAAGMVGMAAFAALSPLIADFLHLNSPVPVLMLALWLVPSVFGAVLQGVLVGHLRFTPIAIATVVGGGAARLLFGVLLVEAGLGVTGAMLATVAATTVTVVIEAWPLRRELRSHPTGAAEHLTLDHGMALLFALGGYWVFAGIDTLLVRNLLSPHPAGLYAAAATGSHIALFIPGAIVTLAFPRFAAQRDEGVPDRSLLVNTVVAVGVLGLAVAALIVALPGPIVHLLFGPGFTGSASAIGTLAVEAALLGIISVLVYYHLARYSIVAQVSWLGVGMAAAGISLFHRSIDQVALVMLLVSALVLLISAAGVVWPVRPRGEQRWARTDPNEDGNQAADVPTCAVSIVVPFYNPGPRFGPHLAGIAAALRDSGCTFEVIAVSDGSTDDSPRVAGGLSGQGIRLIVLPLNAGKGAALRAGMAEAQGDYVGFIDADGDLPAPLVGKFVEVTRTEHAPDIVIGNKRHPESEVAYPLLRRVYSATYHAMVFLLFQLPVRDTQTGLKLIRRDVLAEVVPRMVEKRFAFDLELLVVARRLGYRRIVDAPVKIGDRFSSTISLRAVKGVVIDTMAIFYRLRILHYYDKDLTLEVTLESEDNPAPETAGDEDPTPSSPRLRAMGVNG